MGVYTVTYVSSGLATTPPVNTALLQDYVIIGLAFGVILVVILPAVALLLLLLLIIRKKTKQSKCSVLTMSTDIVIVLAAIRVTPTTKNTNIPKNMTTNPLYEESVIYDHVGSVMSLDMCNVAPPNVPPPRKGSAVRHSGIITISLSKSASSSDVSSPPLQSPATPRYAETPTCVVGKRQSL